MFENVTRPEFDGELWESCYCSVRPVTTHLKYIFTVLSRNRSRRHSFILERRLVLSIWPVMSAYTYQIDTRPQAPYIQSTPEDDVKASFDDLVDPYTSPFAPNSRHQTFMVGTPLKQQPPSSHQREPSVPLSTKAYSLKQSEDTHETSYNYPPTLPQKEVVETQSTWKRVCILLSILHIDQYYCISLFLNRYLVVFISRLSSWRQL
jgi:hypothetical protein